MNDQCRESSTGAAAAAPSRLDDVRDLLCALVTGSQAPKRLPPLLFELAARALPPRQRARDAVQDLVGDLFLHLAQATRAGDRRSAVYLLELDDAQLKAALRQRLRQLAAEGSPRWALVKVARAHVRAALAEPLPAVDALPLSLLHGEKLSHARVTEAVAYLQDAHPEMRGDVGALASELLAEYFPDDVHPEPERWHRLAANDTGSCVEDYLDAAVVAAHVHHVLGHDLEKVLSLRAQGLSLQTIGHRCGKATSTVFAHLREAVARLREGLGEEASLESVRLALWGLAGDPQ